MNWGGEYMQNLHLQIHPVFNPMLSRAIIWDFRLRIADCGFVESLRSINFNGQNSLNLKLYATCRGTKLGLKSFSENNQFSPL
jgi:hypothetical protein